MALSQLGTANAQLGMANAQIKTANERLERMQAKLDDTTERMVAVSRQLDQANRNIAQTNAKFDQTNEGIARANASMKEASGVHRRQDQRLPGGRRPPPVAVNPKLTETARDFANYMARTGRYGHTADGSRPADRAARHGYEFCVIAENIAYAFNSEGYTTEELGKTFVEGWKNSPGHRRNMLDPDVTETGVAVARSEKTGYYYAVQMFGRPKSLDLRFKIVNESEATVTYRIGDQTFTLPPRYIRTHEQCRPTEVAFELPAGGKTVTEAIKAENNDQFVIVDDGGALRVKRG